MAAPMATASSGLTEWLGSLPNALRTASCTAGIRVDPPTNNTWSISLLDNLASRNAFSIGIIVRSTKDFVISSNLARVNVASKCNGPLAPAEINGKLICVCITPLKSFFAFSAASFKRCKAIVSCFKSIPFSFLNVSAIQSTNTLSKSSPPKCVSPFVDNTSKVPSAKSRILTSNVPPPKS